MSGIFIDYAFRVNRRSVFGYALPCILTPTGHNVQTTFRRLLACLLALPGRYRQAIEEHNRTYPTRPFEAQIGPTFILHRPRIEANRAANLGLQDVIDVLIDNRIPPEWVDHSYPFRLAYLEAHHSGNPLYQAMLDETDNERLTWLQRYGIPPAITAWDGWRHPSERDIACLHLIMEVAEDRPLAPCNRNNAPGYRQGLEAPAWLVTGHDGICLHLSSRPEGIAQAYAAQHPVVLPQTAGAMLPPSSHPTIVDSGGPSHIGPPGVINPANAGADSLSGAPSEAHLANAGVDARMDTQEEGP